MKNNNSSRRDFLKKCALYGASGATCMYTGIGGLTLPAMAATRPTGYRALVCLYLTGGNDLNMLIPNSDDAYARYSTIRTNMALSREGDRAILPITSDQNGEVSQFALHHALGGVRSLYNDGNLAFLANVGAIKQPTDKTAYLNKENLPPKLFSHITQKDFIRAGLPFEGEKLTGWGGRISDFYNDTASSRAPLGISFSGNNLWQQGVSTTPYTFNGSGVPSLVYYPDGSSRREALDRVNQLNYEHLFAKEYARTVSESLDLSRFMREGAKTDGIDLPDLFGTDTVSRQLLNVANIINAREGLGMQQQVFYVNIGGYDQHGDLIGRHRTSMEQLNAALASFYQATVDMGVADQVTTFTNSDFGRTLNSNGTGSDHAWGGHQLIMGGAVAGGKVYGDYPEFIEDDPQYLSSRGVLIPSTSHDQMSSTIAKWFGGFTNNELDELFPNLTNFSVKDLGFLT